MAIYIYILLQKYNEGFEAADVKYGLCQVLPCLTAPLRLDPNNVKLVHNQTQQQQEIYKYFRTQPCVNNIKFVLRFEANALNVDFFFKSWYRTHKRYSR